MQNVFPKRKKCRSPNVRGVFTDLHEDDENTPFGFCGLKYSSVQSVQNGDWIRCQECETWYMNCVLGL
jgi:hypothetical protein